MNATKAAHKLRVRIGRFSGDLSEGLCVAAQRFVGDMVYGIQASESVLLTEVGRTLEEDAKLHKTEDRLSRNLQRPGLADVVQNNLLGMAANRVGEDTLLVIDPSDLSKKYAKEMQYLATVRDGSAHDFAQGYWMLHIVGCQVGDKSMVPLYQRLWSAKAPDFSSENDEILRGIDAVSAHVGQRGLWVMDRGGDRINLFDPILDRRLRFLIRLVGNRHVLFRGEKLLAHEVAQRCPMEHSQVIARIEGGEEKRFVLHFGHCRVYLPERPEPLNLLVINGFGAQPLMVLTNEPVTRSFKRQWYLVQAYLRRWCVEETIRYAKTCYDLENVRVLGYQSLQNLMPLVLAAMFFAACVLDHDARLRIMASYVENAAKRVFGIPDFKYYALADGMQALFKRHPGPPANQKRRPTPAQMNLFAFDSS